jgi:hypothetical protein
LQSGDTAASLVITSADINGGTIDGATIGASSASSGVFTSLSDSGNLTFTGTGNRIRGLMDGTPQSNRVAFQTSTTNAQTTPIIIPNGTVGSGAVASGIVWHDSTSSTTGNGSTGSIVNIQSSEIRLTSGIQGTGTYLPIAIHTGGSERLRIDTSGNVGVGTSSPVSNANQTSVSVNGTSVGRFDCLLGGTLKASFQADTVGIVNLRAIAAEPLAFYTTNTERMRIDSSGNVGIGTSSPSSFAKFVVLQTSDSNAFQIATTTNGAGMYWIPTNGFGVQQYSYGGLLAIGTSDSNILSLRTNATERMRIDSSGNVGVGTTSPSSRLHVAGGADSTIRNTASSGSSWFVGSNSSGYILHNESNTPMLFTTNGTERMRIDSSGNVGIGRTTTIGTNCRLNVQLTGTSASGYTAASNAAIAMDCGTGTNGVINLVGGGSLGVYRSNSTGAFDVGIGFGDNSNRILAFDTAGAERMRIDSSGNLLVGKTAISDSTAGVQVYGGSVGAMGLGRSANDAVSQVEFFRGTAGSLTRVGHIQTTTTTSYVTTSDYRLKENIEPMTGGLAKVALLKPCTYTWEADGSSGQGFIAHELQEVVPDCVTGEKDEVDAEGKPVYQGIDTSFLVATLTAAIQELKAEVDALKAQINQ